MAIGPNVASRGQTDLKRSPATLDGKPLKEAEGA